MVPPSGLRNSQSVRNGNQLSGNLNNYNYYYYYYYYSVSLIPGRGDRSPLRSFPESSTGVSDRFSSGGWDTTPDESGHTLGSVRPDILLFHRLHYSWLGGVVVGRRTCDREVAGSTPAVALFGQQPWASCSHLMCLCSLSSIT